MPLLLLAFIFFEFGACAETLAPRAGPTYSAASIVNAADNQIGPLAPNSIATIYGTVLAYTTAGVSSSDVHGGVIPSVLPGTGVHILVGGIPAGIYYVSPGQINFLVPAILRAGPSHVQLTIDGLAGPDISIQIADSAPALFQMDPQTVVGAHVDGSSITSASPAKPGEMIVLYATGLGQVTPPVGDREVPTRAATINQIAALQITIGGAPLDPDQILYAGVSPGFGGLYQINLILPHSIGANPEVRVAVGDPISPANLILPVSP